MLLSNGADISIAAINFNIKRLTNQIYKLLPSREENLEWEIPLSTVIEELSGMDRLLTDKHDTLFSLLCKLEGLKFLTKKEDFSLFRRTIFECLNLISGLKVGE